MRLNLLLLVVLALSALLVVSAQHKARRLHAALEQERARARHLEVEYGRLQLEQSTWAMHARIERIAGERLGMRPIDTRRHVLVPAPAGPKR